MQTAPRAVMTEAQLGTSAAAFVEGGVQDACDDACSICLDNFGEDDPATRTTCKHEYHLQCILEWAQRGKECPMCWRPLRLEDPVCQSLLAASKQERMLRERSSTTYQCSPLDGAEYCRFGDNSDLEDRILHRLAGADIGRVQQLGRRGDLRRLKRPSGQGHPHFIIVPVPSNNTSSTHAPRSSSPDVAREEVGTPSAAYGSLVTRPVRRGRSLERGSVESNASPRQEPVEHEDGSAAGTSSSEFASETFKSRLVAASLRYRESLTKTRRGFREGLRARNSAMAELGNRARELSAGVVRALERTSFESPDHKGDSSSAHNSSARRDAHVITVLVPTGPSCVRGD